MEQTKKLPFNMMDICFAAGVLLVTIVGAVFVTGDWDFMSDLSRAIVTLVTTVFVYLMSLIAGKMLDIQKTSYALFNLGSCLLPITVCAFGAFEVFGKDFSFTQEAGALVLCIALAFFAVAGIAGYKIYNSKAQLVITYFGGTWTLLFLAYQCIVLDGVKRILPSLIALCVIAFITALLVLIMKKENVGKMFLIYTEIMACASVLCTIASMPIDWKWGALLTSLFSTAALIVIQKAGMKHAKYVHPIVSAIILISLNAILDTADINSTLRFILFPVCIGIVVAVYRILNIDTWLSRQLQAFCGLFVSLSFTIYMQFYLEGKPSISSFSLTLLLASFIYLYYAFSKRNHAAERIIGSIGFSWMFMAGLADVVKALDVIDLSVENIRLITLCSMCVISIVLLFIFKKKRTVGLMELTSSSLIVLSIFSYTFVNDLSHIDIISKCGIAVVAMLLAVFVYYSMLENKSKLRPWIVVLLSVALIQFIFFLIIVVVYLPENWNETIGCVAFMYASAIVGAVLCLTNRIFKNDKFVFVKVYHTTLKVLGFILLSVSALMSLGGSDFYCSIILGVVMYALFTLLGEKKITIFPVLIYSLGYIRFLSDLFKPDFNEALLLIPACSTIIMCVVGRLLYKKAIFDSSSKEYDWASFFAFVPALPVISSGGDMAFLVSMSLIALYLLNFSKRENCSKKKNKGLMIAALSVFAFGVLFQNFSIVPSLFRTEAKVVCLLVVTYGISRLLVENSPKAARNTWFISMCVAFFVECMSALFYKEEVDLLILGVVALVVFVYAVTKKRKTWFVLSTVTFLITAVYFSVIFWNSFTWMIYLLVVGLVLIGVAVNNEIRKKKAEATGEKKKLFDEWTM